MSLIVHLKRQRINKSMSSILSQRRSDLSAPDDGDNKRVCLFDNRILEEKNTTGSHAEDKRPCGLMTGLSYHNSFNRSPGKMYTGILLFLSVPVLCHGFLFRRDQSNWNGLKVTWGLNPFSSFKSLPRTQHAAESAGWRNMAPGTACDGNPHFRGARYIKGDDMAVILLFDAHGYIAGIQAGFSKSYTPNPNNFPFDQLKGHPFVLDGHNYFITAYFVDPATICTGRSASQFHTDGTGTGLWIQNGTNPLTSAISIPATQADADKSMWTKGSCFVSMGMHYWYNLRKDMPCNEVFPVFLLYNGGVLNAFGWAFVMDIQNSARYEHPPQNSYGTFMNPPPDCLYQMGTLTTLHIYLTDSATSDTC